MFINNCQITKLSPNKSKSFFALVSDWIKFVFEVEGRFPLAIVGHLNTSFVASHVRRFETANAAELGTTTSTRAGFSRLTQRERISFLGDCFVNNSFGV